MRTVRIACIAEGQGEVSALPILLRRIVAELDPLVWVDIPLPVARIKRSSFVQRGELERAVEREARKVSGSGAILILLDADEDCPATLAPQLLQRAQATRSDVPTAVVLANKEYEAWFLAAAESLRGKRGLPNDLQPPADPESIPGAKEWLAKRTKKGSPYKPTVDQAALTSLFDLTAARACPSFDKLYRDIARLLLELEPSSADAGNSTAP